MTLIDLIMTLFMLIVEAYFALAGLYYIVAEQPLTAIPYLLFAIYLIIERHKL